MVAVRTSRPVRLFMPNTHRWSPLLALAALLAASPALCAAAGLPATAAAAGSTSEKPALAALPLISLLLPLDAPDFAPAAGAVQAGCNAALSYVPAGGFRPRLETVRTDAGAQRLREAWEGAAQRGANVIIGPLTRSGVSALASGLLSRVASPSDPVTPFTLALNVPEDVPRLPPRFHTFGLAIEQEARTIARAAWVEGQRSAIVVQGKGLLDRRGGQAFADEWLAYGGRIVDGRDFDAGTNLETLKAQLAKLESDILFLSADAREARRVRPYLNNQIPVFATSQINDGRQDPGANVDLIGIRFVDMPWLLQPDHAAVMVYRRMDSLGPDLQRFYALGIDACRIAELIIAGHRRIDIDGVTGHLSLDLGPNPQDRGSVAARAVTREAPLASFRDASLPVPPAESPAPRQ